MDTQPSSWIDHQVQQILDDLTAGDPDKVHLDEATVWTFLRYGYGMGYIEGVHERT